MNSITRLVAGLALALGLLAGVSSPALANDNELSPSEKQLLASDVPKIITMDSKTGDILSVQEEGASTFGVTTGCSSTQPCWRAYTTPYANFGFTASGATGTWTQRGNFVTRNRQARLTWQYGGSTVTGPWIPRNSTGRFNAYPVTGKRVALRN